MELVFTESVLTEVKKFHGRRRKFNGQINLGGCWDIIGHILMLGR